MGTPGHSPPPSPRSRQCTTTPSFVHFRLEARAGILFSVMRRSAVLAVLICLAGRVGAQVRHWAETPNETIWRGRYTNCDKGWAVDLPTGVVAHDSLPPSPNHGFLISAVHPGTAAEVNLGDQRIIDVFDEYDAMELGSARAYLDWELKNAGNKNVLEIRETVLQGLRGVQARYELKQRGSAQVVESVIVLRGGVVYHLLLKTTDQHYEPDSALFARVRAGYRLLPFPKGECVNP